MSPKQYTVAGKLV